MKPFVFKKFEVAQDRNVFRVGTDGVLLGALADCTEAFSGLEIGTGSGIISLMLAQRNPNLKILALDIDENAVALAAGNFQNSPFSARLSAKSVDFKAFESEKNFDFIFSNPPYFEVQDSGKDRLARQKIKLDFKVLIEKATQLLACSGILSVIIPALETDDFIRMCSENKLHLVRRVNVKGIANGPLKRNVLEFSFKAKILKEENFVLETSPRVYSTQYRTLTKDFHPHF